MLLEKIFIADGPVSAVLLALLKLVIMRLELLAQRRLHQVCAREVHSGCHTAVCTHALRVAAAWRRGRSVAAVCCVGRRGGAHLAVARVRLDQVLPRSTPLLVLFFWQHRRRPPLLEPGLLHFMPLVEGVGANLLLYGRGPRSARGQYFGFGEPPRHAACALDWRRQTPSWRRQRQVTMLRGCTRTARVHMPIPADKCNARRAGRPFILRGVGRSPWAFSRQIGKPLPFASSWRPTRPSSHPASPLTQNQSVQDGSLGGRLAASNLNAQHPMRRSRHRRGREPSAPCFSYDSVCRVFARQALNVIRNLITVGSHRVRESRARG